METDDVRSRADARLEAALAERGLADPRPELRDRLRQLRDASPTAFERARRHYEERTLPRLAEGEPIEAWVEYVHTLGELTAPGRLVSIDASGRAREYAGTAATGELVLFVSEADAGDAFIAVAPAAPSPPQQATVDLLVRGRVEL